MLVATLSRVCGSCFLFVFSHGGSLCVVQDMLQCRRVISMTGVHSSLVVAAPCSVRLDVAGGSNSDSILDSQ